jgi:hypothetical protein
MQRAWQLGRKMAMSQPMLRPMLTEAATYSQYEEFRKVHRSLLENRDAFTPWDDQVTALAEREAHRIGMRLESSQALDLFITRLVVPMKHAFWLGWEATRGLERLHAEARKRLAQEASGGPVKVFCATQLAERVQKPEVRDSGDEGFWVSITGGEVAEKDQPQVLAARALVNNPKPEKVKPAEDELVAVGVEVDEICADAVMPGSATEKRPPAMLTDDELPDLYEA